MNYCQSDELKEPFPADYGVGLLFSVIRDEKEIECVSYAMDMPQRCTLEITTWLGVSIGAQHYYARIHARNRGSRAVNEGETMKYWSSADKAPKEIDSFEITVTRPIIQRDIDDDMDNDEECFCRKWPRKFGQFTNGFWTEQEAIEKGISEFKRLFVGWILKDDQGNLIVNAQGERVGTPEPIR